MKRDFFSFTGVDLGGGRGKTTALAELRVTQDGKGVEVIEVATRCNRHPWTDDTLTARLSQAHPRQVIAIDAPLAPPACGRCTLPVCPGVDACAEPSVVWLRSTGRALVQQVGAETMGGATVIRPHLTAHARLAPYAHRATDVVMTYQRGLLPISTLTAATGAIAARAGQLRRRLASSGFTLHKNLIEVSPAATITALCGARIARGYKRDADPWRTRATILEKLHDLTFAPASRMAREEVLRSDHSFDAVIAAYTAYLWARDGWELPSDWFAEDGWVFSPG